MSPDGVSLGRVAGGDHDGSPLLGVLFAPLQHVRDKHTKQNDKTKK